jgi:hypothetical protein
VNERVIVILKNMVVYDVLTFLQTMAFVCSTCVDLDFEAESSLLIRYGLFGVRPIIRQSDSPTVRRSDSPTNALFL